MPHAVQEILLPMDINFAPLVLLKAGPVTCMYENGKLRYLRSGNTELLRMIYVAVRDSNWQTLLPNITEEKIEKDGDSFSIQYNALHHYQDKPVYKTTVSIIGQKNGNIQFTLKGEALESFKRNRIGICLHHPIKEANGQLATITQPDGNVYEANFPVTINPHQPFVSVQQMSWQTPDKHHVQLSFEGDVFETEDQRNWSDSSFKTYSTPLTVPLPITLSAGDKIEQSVTCIVTVPMQPASVAENNAYEEKLPFPSIGYCRLANATHPNADTIKLLKKIPHQHYRVTLLLQKGNWQQVLKEACEEAKALQIKLQLVVMFTDDYAKELVGLLPAIKESQSYVSSLLPLKVAANVVPADMHLAIYTKLKESFSDLPIGYGTDGNFVNINRNRPASNSFDFVSFALYPQAHSKDERSILENLDNQPDMIATAKTIANGKPVFVSPVTLHDRNGKATADARQTNAFGAWWLLMSLQQLSMADSITLNNLLENDGLLYGNNTGDANELSEVFKVLSAIQDFAPVYLIKRYNGATLLTDGLMLENKTGERLFIKAPAEIREFRS